MARKILLADDSVTAQNMGRRILTDAGYEVVTVNNGSAALKRIAESKPDLIILDVYMPGYGGLEVCQRVRENTETARIPVLLTVGKLEPFKAEEVRRVRADAFIVKPFEASELLTALTRLEDKIVPQPQAYKPGRFAKAIAAIDGSGTPEYGDPEKGWKNRLKIPPPDRKPREDESEEAPAAKAETKEASARSETTAAPTAAMLRGVTAEEIAAIEAAAAALTGQTQPAVEPVEAQPAQPPPAELATASPETDTEAWTEPPATFASISSEESQDEIPQPQAEVPAPAPVIAASMEPAESVTEAPVEQPEPVPVIEPAEIESQVEAVSNPPSEEHVEARSASAEEEVDAALASLAPANGHGVSLIPGIPGNGAAKGPRWIAEAVALTESESSVILEEEMQRALAAFAAVDAARSGWPAVEEVVTVSTIAVEESVPPAQVVDAVAESIVSTIEAPVPEAAVAEPEAAFAAAAGAEIVATPVDMPTSLIGVASEVAESTSTAEFDQQRESELAAAWASWKQVRDSVGSEQFTSQLADAAAAGLQDLPKQETIATPELPVEAAAAPEESGAIASIVDTVLAELKPRLMEEIAKKMKK